MKRRICSFDMVAVPENAYVVTDDQGEINLCNARCLCLWAMTLATKPDLAEKPKTERLKLNTPFSEGLQFESIVELALWAGANALKTTLARTSKSKIGPKDLVRAFYERIWNSGELSAVAELLTVDFAFRSSLGNELLGLDPFSAYVRSIRGDLAQYRCEILDCVAEGEQAFARMRFSGIHEATFRGFEPTEKLVSWMGAALFQCRDGLIAELWVLGDLAG